MRKLRVLLIGMLFGALVQAQTLPKTFTITATTSPCASIQASNNSAVGIIVSGTFSGTLTSTVYIYPAQTAAKQVFPLDSSTGQSTITAAGGFTVTVGGFQMFQLCPTAWTSGTAVVQIYAAPVTGPSAAASGGSGGTVVQGSAGTNAQAWWVRVGDATNGPAAVKPASTGSVAADPSLVVQLSPNQSALTTPLAVTAAQPTAANFNATVVQPTAANFNATVAQPTAANFNATVVQATGANLHAVLDAASIESTDMTGTVPGTAPSNTKLVGCIFNSANPAPTTGQTLPCQGNSQGDINVSTRPISNSGNSSLSAAQEATLTTSVNVKASAGSLYGMTFVNGAASVCYVEFQNAATAGTLGTATLVSIPLPASSQTTIMFQYPIQFSTGIAVGIGTTVNGATACGTAGNGTVFYK